MEVEVVSTEVGEHGQVEDHAVDPALHQGVAGDLHRAGGHRPLLHHREQAVEVRRLGRGQRGLDLLAVDAGADRADDGRPDARSLEGALGEPGGGGLALGAGDAEHPQRAGRVAVHVGREAAEQRPRCRDLEDRHARWRAAGTGRVGEDGDRAGLDGRRGVVDAMGAAPGQGGVDVAGQHALRGEGEARRGAAKVAVCSRRRVGSGQPGGQLGQGTTGRVLGSARPELFTGRVAQRVNHQGEATCPGLQVVGSWDGAEPVGGTP